MRAYGKFELLYEESHEKGVLYLKFPAEQPPEVMRAANGKLEVKVRDELTSQSDLQLPVDLVVLVTGMVQPRERGAASGRSSFRSAGTASSTRSTPSSGRSRRSWTVSRSAAPASSPRPSSESVTSGLAAVTWSAAMLKQGRAELDPQVATIDPELCSWCGACVESCPYDRDQPARHVGRQGRGGDRRRHLQGLRRLRTDMPPTRDRPAGLHQPRDGGHD